MVNPCMTWVLKIKNNLFCFFFSFSKMLLVQLQIVEAKAGFTWWHYLAPVMWEARPDQMIIKVLSGFTIYEITNLRTEPLSLTTLLVGETTAQGAGRPLKKQWAPHSMSPG